MKKFILYLSAAFIFLATENAVAQFSRIDSTLKMGKAGYKILCNNKNPEQNDVTIKPIGFDKDAREVRFIIKGRISKAEIDDLNNDGFPDLVVYIYSGPNAEFGTVYCFASDQNKNYVPFPLPDVMLDGKLNDGYQGHDEFNLLEGKLMRQFPIYKPDDPKGKPSGGKRVILYNIASKGGGGFEFKILRTYDIK